MSNSSQKKLKNSPKKLGLALSGCSARAITYVGFLEVLDENHIPVSGIAACSSSSIIASTYAAGTLGDLKKKYLSLTKKEIWDLFEPSFRGGIFSIEKIEPFLKEFIPHENIEDLNIPVALMASDITQGKSVALTMGNIFRAIKASCAYPGWFEPVMWGNKVLVDGGLFVNVPGEAARSLGVDIVVGIDLAPLRNDFSDYFLRMKKTYNLITKPIYKIVGSTKEKILEGHGEHISELRAPNFLAVIDRASDYAIVERRKEENFDCELIVEPDVKIYDKFDSDNFENMYHAGRRSAELALPAIKKLLEI